MERLASIDVLSAATLVAVLGACVGLVCGLLYSGAGFFIDLYGPGLNAGTVLAFGALVGMPAILAAGGFVLAAIGAIVYNVLAGWLGGLPIRLEFS